MLNVLSMMGGGIWVTFCCPNRKAKQDGMSIWVPLENIRTKTRVIMPLILHDGTNLNTGYGKYYEF